MWNVEQLKREMTPAQLAYWVAYFDMRADTTAKPAPPTPAANDNDPNQYLDRILSHNNHV